MTSIDPISPGEASTTDHVPAHMPELLKIASNNMMGNPLPYLESIIVRASGVYMYDHLGRRVMDLCSGQLSATLGHSHPEILATIEEQGKLLHHITSFMLSLPPLEVTRELLKVLPSELTRCMYYSTGSETVECALRLAKLYTQKHEVVAFASSYHGLSAGAGSVTHSFGKRGYGPSVPGVFVLPQPNPHTSPFRHKDGTYDWKTELEWGWQMIDKQSTGQLAACIYEPIGGNAGFWPMPDGYVPALKAECAKRGMLLIADEAISGLGRTGDMFAIEHDGVVPDILLISKAFGGGLALGAVFTTDEIYTKCNERGWVYVTSHMNDPLPCAVGATILRVIQRDGLVKEAKRKGDVFAAGLRKLQEKYSSIYDIRGRGLMIGIEVGPPTTMAAANGEHHAATSTTHNSSEKPNIDGSFGSMLAAQCLALGFLMSITNIPGLNGVFRLCPPLIITDEQIHEALKGLEKALELTTKEWESGQRGLAH